jgi:probable F420-dependent oxidoreductase
MRFAISIPQVYGDGEFDPDGFRAYMQRVEELGFESAWTQESVLGSSPQIAPLEAMTYAAACTERIRLGCTVFVTTLHSPLHLAKALSSLDQLSGGRVEVGVGTGGKNRQFAAFGMSPDRYVARFTEGLTVMKALWTEPRVTFDGEFWQLTDAAMEPKPAQKPHPPIWFGANGEAALRRAVRLGDGFFGAGSTPTERFAGQVRVVRTALAEAGHDQAGFPIAKRIYIAVDDDAARGRERVNATMARIYGRRVPDIEAAAVAGTPDDCVREVREAAAAGAELILFTTLFDPADQAERLAAEVMPRVAAAV